MLTVRYKTNLLLLLLCAPTLLLAQINAFAEPPTAVEQCDQYFAEAVACWLEVTDAENLDTAEVSCSRLKKGGYRMTFEANESTFGCVVGVYQEYQSKRCTAGLSGMLQPIQCSDVRRRSVPLIPKDTSKFKRGLEALCESYLIE